MRARSWRADAVRSLKQEVAVAAQSFGDEDVRSWAASVRPGVFKVLYAASRTPVGRVSLA
jgi:hypothetical protein